jgi:Domain of unknown function (DUF4180)
MPDNASSMHGIKVLICAPDGPKLRSDCDVPELIGHALEQDVDLVIIPKERLDDDFFALRTRIAGEVIQKFVNYRLSLAIVGDISLQVSENSALRDFVAESNRGHHIWFVTNLPALDERLKRAHHERQGAARSQT